MDAVVIMPDHSQGKAEEDASVLATILQTRAACAVAARDLRARGSRTWSRR